MRIAINLIPFSSIQGTEIFLKNIISNILKFKKNEKFFIFCTEDLPPLLNFPQLETIKIKGLKFKYGKALYQQIGFYFLLKKYQIDFLFSPSPIAPIFYKNKIVVIHDCAYDRFFEFENLFSKTYFKIIYYSAKYFSKKIITISNFSKNELIKLYKINPNKIEVICEGVPELPGVSEDFIQKTLNKFKIDRPYFLYIGNWRPRKNLIGLIKAFKIFREKNNLDFLLVIGGKRDKRFLDLEGEIKKNQLERRVILTDILTREEVAALYKKAKMLTFPSFYEGFGLPILEAQSLGIPVLTSNISSLPEVGGNSVLYVNPYNVEEIAQGMEKITFDEKLRQALVKKGFENIKRFSWEKSAQKLIDLFHNF
ncbi:MAG: glycosyltransferase family 4 protein [Candidatus Pacebacteria bacterium]|nr:glycosyltransferase family 4 protein [Candidatus Paceibacterota bacterium]